MNKTMADKMSTCLLFINYANFTGKQALQIFLITCFGER